VVVNHGESVELDIAIQVWEQIAAGVCAIAWYLDLLGKENEEGGKAQTFYKATS